MGFNDFNKNHDELFRNFDRNAKRGASVIGIIWALSTLLSLGAIGVLAYVAWHFIAKVW